MIEVRCDAYTPDPGHQHDNLRIRRISKSGKYFRILYKCGKSVAAKFADDLKIPG